MQHTVLTQLDELNRMTTAQLRQRWRDLMGTDPGSLGRKYLIRRLAYRIQELAYGGLSQATRRGLKLVADGHQPKSERQVQKTDLQPGTRLLREWHGERYEVLVKAKGFLYNGKHYKSLTAVALAITGAHWNGYKFFGLKSNRRSQQEKT